MNAIPWYRSNVLRALLLGLVAFVLKKAGLADQFPNTEELVNNLLDLVQIIAGLWAGYARVKQPTPPVTLTKAAADVQPPQASIFATLLALIFVLPMLHGCETFAVGRAQTLEQKAAASLGDFNIFQAAALEIGKDVGVVPEVRKGVLDAAIAAKPVADEVDKTLREYRSIKRQIAAGQSTDEKLAIVASNLQSWTQQLVPLVSHLRELVEEQR